MTSHHGHATDFSFLRKEGVDDLARLAGSEWTDFNTHDPGITILEQICYAITDLGYRTSFDIPDLLAEGGDDGVGRLYRPSQVLTCHPVSLTDLRKLVMDVDGVKNAWLELVEDPAVPLHFHPGKNQLSLEEEPPASEPVHLKGLYRVLVEKSELADIDGETVRRSVVTRLQANRALCEDFEEIKLLGSQDVTVNARVEIGQVEDAGAILLGIYERISDYLSPRVPFQTLGQMLDAGMPIDEIFDGPVLEHGFIDTTALKGLHRRVAVHTSDLIREIMSVEGVRAVRSISLGSDSKVADWVLEFAPDMAPTFNLESSGVTLQRDQLEVSVDLDGVVERYHERQRGSRVFHELDPSERDVIPPRGRDRKLADYHSIQHQFPQVYGIGAAGLPRSASPARRAQARQLKAYLMLFDQLLANFFAQLAHTKDLLSFEGQGAGTYFSRMIEDPELELDAIREGDADRHRELLHTMTGRSEQSGEPVNRRNRFLNHLLARFAEHFTDYSLMLHGARSAHWESSAEQLIHDKQAFLQRYPRVSSGRGTAFDYTRPAEPDNASGLEERLRLKLGLVETEEETFFLVEHILLRAIAADSGQGVPLLAATRSKDPYSLQLSLVFPDWPARFQKAGFRLLVEQTIREETPAHLTPYVHWLSRGAMKTFEQVYRDWMDKLRILGVT